VAAESALSYLGTPAKTMLRLIAMAEKDKSDEQSGAVRERKPSPPEQQIAHGEIGECPKNIDDGRQYPIAARESVSSFR
jgi:hypothetical protein